MPPIPPMPPMSGIAGAPPSSGLSATTASVVKTQKWNYVFNHVYKRFYVIDYFS
ncbi:hypothetical protein V2B21_26185 [Priestia megaterium]